MGDPVSMLNAIVLVFDAVLDGIGIDKMFYTTHL